ncbi:tyrocidine synthetase-3 [Chitinophaga costaii]|uniref:Tyrocidine synthetase-3 n=1 Tax=Chitinophaga costaii TaxID=1335309 RepID=A0A1C3YUB8_9BACT|nr:non-ribosomal peptide synthetase [Chitinophaga costaii]PUZ30107.1 amino acid adenylation domain-containing protein [Chitinophaga costaii]SCB73622.1 tyrocidine synthetase-3 [Chitinophaga costaii]
MKLEKSNVQDILELSFAQQGMLFHYLEDSRTNLYNMQAVFDISGAIDVALLEQAFRKVQADNEILRTVFEWKKVKRPLQIVLKSGDLVFEHHFIEDQKNIDQLIATDRNRRFDLQLTPFRIHVITISPVQAILIVTHHHILFDGWSTGILLKEVFTTYRQLQAGAAVPPARKQAYREAMKHITVHSGASPTIKYWKENLREYEINKIPFQQPPHAAAAGKVLTWRHKADANKLKEFAAAHRVTRSAVICTAYGMLLQQYLNTADVVFAMPVSVRDTMVEGVENVMGVFINTLPFRFNYGGGETLLHIVQGVHTRLIEQGSHSLIAYNEIKTLTGIKPREHLFDSILTLENYPLDMASINCNDGFRLELRSTYGDTGIPLVLIVFFDTDLDIIVNYQAAVVGETFVQQLTTRLVNIIDAITTNPYQPLSELPALLPEEQARLLHNFNNTAVTFSAETVLELFNRQVQQQPDTVAVSCGAMALSYKELDQRSNELANCLIAKYGLKPGDFAGILLERSEWLVISILAVLKTGAAYVPIDPNYPEERKKYIINDANIKVLLMEMWQYMEWPDTGAPVLTLDVEFSADPYPDDAPPVAVTPQELAYVIYTSGSTGYPKGVMIKHASLHNYVSWAARSYTNDAIRNFALFTSPAFDLTVTAIFTPLCTGGCLFIFNERDPAMLLQRVFTHEQVQVLKLTPSHLKILLEAAFPWPQGLEGKRILVLGGEQLDTALAKDFCRLYAERIEIFNEYGPTEATVGCMIQLFDPQSTTLSVPIGRPAANTSIYLLDRLLRPALPGTEGELYIGGDCLAAGYLNKEALTAKRFIADPFAGSGARMYKTGDLARWLPDGTLEYVGREDDQLKINGYRIEPGEIESLLKSHPDVQQAVVTLVNKAFPGKGMAAYYQPVIARGHSGLNDVLRQYLQDRLPDYMVPGIWIAVEHFPLTTNGKLNYAALPSPDGTHALNKAAVGYVAPETETECVLASIWEEILQVGNIGVLDDFFALGGESLSATRVANRIRQQLYAEVSINALFDHTVLRELGRYVDRMGAAQLPPLHPATLLPERIPLSFGQQRLWFLDQFEGAAQYHITLALQVDGEVGTSQLTDAFRLLTNRHQPLRTVFPTRAGEPYQLVLPENSWQLTGEKNMTDDAEEVIRAFIHANAAQPFNLAADHPLRVWYLLRNGQLEYIVITVHHIAFDGWSNTLFMNELMAIYNGAIDSLPPLALQYTDYSSWQHTVFSGQLMEAGIQYWETQLREVAALELPADMPRPLQSSYNGADHSFFIDHTTLQRIQEQAAEEDLTLFTWLFTLFQVLLYRYSGQTDVCTGIPVANREQAAIEGLIGYFSNTLAVRTQIQPDQSFRVLLQQVKALLITAYKYAFVPLEKVIDRVGGARDPGRSPLFQYMFILQDKQAYYNLQLGDANAVPVEFAQTKAKFDLTLEVTPAERGLTVVINYNTDLFLPATIRQLGTHYEMLMAAALSSPDIAVSRLNMLTAVEHLLLQSYNHTNVAIPAESTLLDDFNNQVARDPKAVALIFEEAVLSYEELDKASNQLAHLLLAQGVGAGTPVVICLDRSFEMMIGLLGILKAGGAYVPIDPAYPQARIHFIINDTGAGVVLTQLKYAAAITTDVTVFSLDEQPYATYSAISPGRLYSATQAAYIIYTSGTTGQPKGVVNLHNGVYSHLLWMRGYLQLNEQAVFLQKTTFCFDVSVWELFLPLMIGATLVLPLADGQKDPLYLQQLMARYGVTLVHFVPSMLSVFLQEADPVLCKDLRMVVCSGEELKPALAASCLALLPDISLYNLYGPTEAAIDVTAIKVEHPHQYNTGVPIGRPVNNVQLYIVNEAGSLQPPGISGELLIGGIQVAKGYLNRPGQTAKAFISNPVHADDPFRVYRTGDQAMWLPDGNIAYLGRGDHQVKIRGYRIETAELEKVIEAQPHVLQAQVVVKEQATGNKWLAAYITTTGGFEKTALQQALKLLLPEYMQPSRIIVIDNFPLSANGKINRNALPEPDQPVDAARVTVAPATEVEIKLAAIWASLLPVSPIGIRDNFFELGGHSLLATQLLYNVHQQFAVRIPLQTFFKLGTIDNMARYLEVIGSSHENIRDINVMEL